MSNKSSEESGGSLLGSLNGEFNQSHRFLRAKRFVGRIDERV